MNRHQAPGYSCPAYINYVLNVNVWRYEIVGEYGALLYQVTTNFDARDAVCSSLFLRIERESNSEWKLLMSK